MRTLQIDRRRQDLLASLSFHRDPRHSASTTCVAFLLFLIMTLLNTRGSCRLPNRFHLPFFNAVHWTATVPLLFPQRAKKGRHETRIS